MRKVAAIGAVFVAACGGSSAAPLPTGPAAFLGVWAPAGGEGGSSVSSKICGTAAPVVSPITSDLTILSGQGGTIVASTSNGCKEILTVSADSATAMSGQTCTLTSGDGGTPIVETVSSYMLIVHGSELTSAATGSLMETVSGKPETCSVSSEGMYTKQ